MPRSAEHRAQSSQIRPMLQVKVDLACSKPLCSRQLTNKSAKLPRNLLRPKHYFTLFVQAMIISKRYKSSRGMTLAALIILMFLLLLIIFPLVPMLVLALVVVNELSAITTLSLIFAAQIMFHQHYMMRARF